MIDTVPKEKPRCLLVEDDKDMQTLIAGLLQQKNLAITAVDSLLEAVKALHQQSFQLCLLDMHLSDGHGFQLLEKIQEIDNDHERPDVIIITAYGNIPTAVKALKQGAKNFISKPISAELLFQAIDTALSPEKAELDSQALPLTLVGRHRTIMDFRRDFLKLSANHLIVFLTGSQGSGKQALANFVHRQLSRESSTELEVIHSRDYPPEHQTPFHTVVKQAMQTTDDKSKPVVVIDELSEISQETWAVIQKILHHTARNKSHIHLILLSEKPPAEILAAVKNVDPNTFEHLQDYHLQIPSLTDRLSDGEILMRHSIDRHTPSGVETQFQYSKKPSNG